MRCPSVQTKDSLVTQNQWSYDGGGSKSVETFERASLGEFVYVKSNLHIDCYDIKAMRRQLLHLRFESWQRRKYFCYVLYYN